VQIAHKYSQAPAISSDGKLIACYYLDERSVSTKIALIPFEGGEPLKLFDLLQPFVAGLYPVRWTHDGSALTYIVNRGGISNIWIQPLDGNPPRQLTDFKSDRIFSFDWWPDRNWLALSRGPEQRDVVLMTDFKWARDNSSRHIVHVGMGRWCGLHCLGTFCTSTYANPDGRMCWYTPKTD